MTKGDVLRIALVGCGGIGAGHISAYQAMGERCRLAYCVDIDTERAQAWAVKAGCAWATDYESVLDDVDAVDICTPPHLHAPMTIAAAKSGKSGGGYETRLTSFSNLSVGTAERVADVSAELACELIPGPMPAEPVVAVPGQAWTYGTAAPEFD